MSDHDRGAYAPPTDAPLSFDARQPVRGSRPLPVTLIISVLVLAGLGVAIFMFYRGGVRQAGQPPVAVGQPVAGIKAPPPAQAPPRRRHRAPPPGGGAAAGPGRRPADLQDRERPCAVRRPAAVHRAARAAA